MRRLRDQDVHGAPRYTMREKMFAVGDDSGSRPRRPARVQGERQGDAPARHAVIEGRTATSCSRSRRRSSASATRWRSSADGGPSRPSRRRWWESATATRSRSRKAENCPAKGNIVDHEYEIERDSQKVAEVSKKWFRVRDAYGIEVAPGGGRRAGPRGHGLHRPDGTRLEKWGDGPLRSQPSHVHRRELGRELRRRRGLRSTPACSCSTCSPPSGSACLCRGCRSGSPSRTMAPSTRC